MGFLGNRKHPWVWACMPPTFENEISRRGCALEHVESPGTKMSYCRLQVLNHMCMYAHTCWLQSVAFLRVKASV